MLSIKKDPTKLMEVAQDDFKSGLSSLLEQKDETKPAESFLEKAEEKHQKTVEVIKASPKAFKKALKSWEKIVPEAATILLQTSSPDDDQDAIDLAERARNLH